MNILILFILLKKEFWKYILFSHLLGYIIIYIYIVNSDNHLFKN